MEHRRGAGAGSVTLAGVAAQLAGLIWFLQWGHALVTHGHTEYNLARVWLGMTWFDSGKFLAPAFLLLIPAIVVILGRTGADRWSRRGGRATIVLLIGAAVTTAMQFWPYAWGTYRDTMPAVTYHGGWMQALTSSGLLTIALLAFCIRAARLGALPFWIVPVLAVGSLSTVFLAGPLPPVPGLAWLVLGGWLLTQAGRTPAATASAAPRRLTEVV